jgi:hypothetical protein
MASQERLSIEAAAERLGITPDAVRSRIKRGTLWAIRRNGREQVMLRDPPAQGPGNSDPPATEEIMTANEGAPVRLRAEIRRQKHRVMALERERERLIGQLERQHKLLDLEYALRARLQDQIDRLCDRLATALPEVVAGDPAEGADLLWKRLERQVERLSEDPPGHSR